MDALDWDNPAVEEQWCADRSQQVTEYLAREGLKHGEAGSWPAWHVAPYISLWAVESLLAPGNVGWWAICGDLPTDYLSASTPRHPRKALREFANTWKEVAASMLKGVPHPDIRIGPPQSQSEIAELLGNGSEVLLRFADDNSFWGTEYG